MRRVMTWDWIAPLRIARTTLGVSLALAVVFGLASRPASSNLHWGLKTTIAWVVWVWESIFGVNAVGSAKATGSLAFFGTDLQGSASGSAGIGAMPLTLTVITFGVALVAYRRSTASSVSAVSALLLGVRAAALTALPLFVVSLFVSLNANDLTGLFGQGDGTLSQQWQSLSAGGEASVSVSSTDALLVSFALLVATFAGSTLLRREWFSHGIWATVQLCLAAPLRAVGRLCVAIVVGGFFFELVVWLVRWNSSWPSGGHRPSFSAHQWVNGFAGAIAYAGNAGAMALGLGSFGQVGYSASTHSSAALSGSRSPHEGHWIGWFAQTDHLASGVWVALLVAPIVLLYVAWSIARTHGSDPRSVLTSLGTWLVSLVAAIPILASIANLSIGGSGSADVTSGAAGFSGQAQGSVTLGMSVLICTFAVFVYALVVCAALAARARATPVAQSSAADTDLLSSPQ